MLNDEWIHHFKDAFLCGLCASAKNSISLRALRLLGAFARNAFLCEKPVASRLSHATIDFK
jgi:hypothetical protein